MLSFLLCSILAFSMFPSVSAEFSDDRHHVARVIVGAIIALGCFIIFLISISYLLRRRRRAVAIPLRQSFHQVEAGPAFQPHNARHIHSAGYPVGGYQYRYNSYPQSHPKYSNINLPTYNPPDIPPPAYAKE